MSLNVFLSERAKEKILYLNKIRPDDVKKINDKIILLTQYPDVSNLWIKKLKGGFSNCFCLKVNKYRIKFGIENGDIYITEIDDRKDAYR